MKMLIRFLYTILFFLLVAVVAAQPINEKNFIRYSTKDGLSSNAVSGVAQDKYGYIWVSTYKGLNRFDGTSFQQFYADSSQESLPVDQILKLKWLNEDELAALTLVGLHIINTRTLQTRNIFIPSAPKKQISSHVVDVLMDKEKNLFLINTAGFFQFNSKDELAFRFDFAAEGAGLGLKTAFGLGLAQTENNVLLLSTFHGPYIYHIAEKDLHPVGEKDEPFYKQFATGDKLFMITHADSVSFSAMVPDNNEFFWIDLKTKTKSKIDLQVSIKDFQRGFGTYISKLDDSLCIINKLNNGTYLLHRDRLTGEYSVGPEVYFNDYLTRAFYVDKTKQLWIATDKGLLRQKRSISAVKLTTIAEVPGPAGYIMSITVAGDKVFAGTPSQGLMIFNRDDLKFIKQIDLSKYGNANYIGNSTFFAISLNNDTVLTSAAPVWINAKNLSHSLVKIPRNDSLFAGTQELFKDSKGNIFIKQYGTSKFFIRKAGEKDFKLFDYNKELSSIVPSGLMKLSEDPQGNIWFSGNGIIRFNTRLQKFDTGLYSFPSMKISSTGVGTRIAFDKQGKMYFGVWRNGLIIYDPKQKKFKQLTRRDGLPDNDLSSIILHKDKVWMSCESGFANYDLVSGKVTTFGVADGFPSEGMVDYPLYYDPVNNQIYGGMRNILYRFNPDELDKKNSPPDFFVEKIIVGGDQAVYHPADRIELTYKENNLILDLGTVNFDDTHIQQFAFRLLDNSDEPWQELGLQKNIIFSNLSPGKHKLELKVYARNNSWPEQIKSLDIIVHPPFWKTPWFYILVLLSLASVIYYLHRRRVSAVTQKANIDRQLSEMEMKGLHAQMNPHFIFNCLNSIREMILNSENKEASHYLSKFAQLIRITLDQSTRSFVSLKNTIDYLERYLEMEKIRNNLFTYEIKIDEQLQTDEIMIPPMLIQPFLENSIWHGAIPGKELSIIVHFTKEEDKLLCVIEDNGVGIETSLKKKSQVQIDHNPIGIANVKERIHVLNEKYNLHSRITIDDKSALNGGSETGTRVKLFLQLNSIAL